MIEVLPSALSDNLKFHIVNYHFSQPRLHRGFILKYVNTYCKQCTMQNVQTIKDLFFIFLDEPFSGESFTTHIFYASPNSFAC